MRKLLFTIWALAPLGVAAYHFGPGQHHLLMDDLSSLVEKGSAAAESGKWEVAFDAYSSALQGLPPGEVATSRKLRLERAKAGMLASQLPSSRSDLRDLLDDIESDPAASEELAKETRSALACAQYYMTWLLRLEGQPRGEWESEIEASRQNYRLLAEQSDDPVAQKTHQENLEASIRLARMDLGELQGLPLPSQ